MTEHRRFRASSPTRLATATTSTRMTTRRTTCCRRSSPWVLSYRCDHRTMPFHIKLTSRIAWPGIHCIHHDGRCRTPTCCTAPGRRGTLSTRTSATTIAAAVRHGTPRTSPRPLPKRARWRRADTRVRTRRRCYTRARPSCVSSYGDSLLSCTDGRVPPSSRRMLDSALERRTRSDRVRTRRTCRTCVRVLRGNGGVCNRPRCKMAAWKNGWDRRRVVGTCPGACIFFIMQIACSCRLEPKFSPLPQTHPPPPLEWTSTSTSKLLSPWAVEWATSSKMCAGSSDTTRTPASLRVASSRSRSRSRHGTALSTSHRWSTTHARDGSMA